MEKIRLGIIGIGNMGSEHCRLILSGQTPEIALTCVADPRQDRRDGAQQTLPAGTGIYADGMSLIRAHACDAVLIATPHYQHPPLAIEAFKNGLHVMVEKPAGVYTLQVREMNAEADRHPELTFGMMFNQRTNCTYRKMHELIHSGAIGDLKRVNWIITDWYRTQFYYDSGAWRATWAGEGGGVLLNQCPHQLDLVQWLVGLPCKVQGFCHEGKWHNIEVEDDVTAYFAQSEQTPTACALGVLVDRDQSVKVAGGYLLQLLPGAPDEVIDALEKGISRAGAVTPMLEAGMTPEDILGQVCGSLGVAFLETTEVTYKCYCTRERVERALISLGRKELEEIRQEGKTFPVECQFCDAVYSFTPEDIGKLLEKI